MTEIPRWEEAESQVHIPGLWPAFLFGSVFLAGGGLSAVDFFVRGEPIWAVGIGLGIFVFGAIVLAHIIRCVISPVYVRPAAPGTLPDVPNEPVLLEGSVVQVRLTHELVRVAEGWQFRPLQTLWRDDKRLFLGFGILFLPIFSAMISWFHSSRRERSRLAGFDRLWNIDYALLRQPDLLIDRHVDRHASTGRLSPSLLAEHSTKWRQS